MKTIIKLLTLIAIIVSLGCATNKSPTRIAYTATDSVLTTADAAIVAWADYVVAKKREIAAVQALGGEENIGRALGMRTDLLKAEGKVAKAYDNYQIAATNAVTLGSTSTGNIEAQLATALSVLINVVNFYVK